MSEWVDPYTRLDAVSLLETLTIEQIEQVYEGKPGCGCGCNGEYSKDEEAKRRVLRTMKRSAGRAEATSGNGLIVIALETSSRYRWIYLR